MSATKPRYVRVVRVGLLGIQDNRDTILPPSPSYHHPTTIPQPTAFFSTKLSVIDCERDNIEENLLAAGATFMYANAILEIY